MSKILLFGCYNQGNFGDDLMAIFFSRILQDEGHDVTVYRLPNHLSVKYKIKSSSNPFHCVRDCDIIVLGGGALLKNGDSSHHSVKRHFKEFGDAITGLDVPIFCMSIGTSKINDLALLDPVRKKIFNNANFRGGLLRLRKDLILFDDKVEYVPDVVLCTELIMNKYFGLYKNEKSDKVAINATWSNYMSVGKLLFQNRNSDFVLFKTHDPRSGVNAEIVFPGLRSYTNRDPLDTVIYLSSFKTIYSSKLHLGVAGVSMGLSFCTINAPQKTIDFIEDMDEYLSVINEKVFDLQIQDDVLNCYVAFAKDL